jgi:PHD/YefM family antitoxin component YafN of YafNO toxin-antitoxin module
MATVTIDEATKSLPTLLRRAHHESIIIRNDNGDDVMLLSLKPKSEEERQAAWERLEQTSKVASAELAENLAKDGISIEEFLADALADD